MMVKEYLDKLKVVIDLLDIDKINDLTEILFNAYKKGNTVYSIGNGGSAATATHFACDLRKGTKQRLRVISLCDNVAIMTACANDTNYAHIFVEQLTGVLRPGDMVVAFSGSGNSTNVVEAIRYANENKAITISITGFDGGRLKKESKFNLTVPIDNMQISEDFHLIITHIIMRTLQAIV